MNFMLSTMLVSNLLFAIAFCLPYVQYLAANTSTNRQKEWLKQAVQLATGSCQRRDPTLGDEAMRQQCRRFTRAVLMANASTMAIYWTHRRPPTSRKSDLRVALPDGSLPKLHADILALDPFPWAPMAHLVFVFGVVLDEGEADCRQDIDAHYFHPHHECLRLLYKSDGQEIDFLPSIFQVNVATSSSSSPSIQSTGRPRLQRLKCLNAAGFAPCSHRDAPSPARWQRLPRLDQPCDDDGEETSGDCWQQRLGAIAATPSCQWLRVCSQAAVISGGAWTSSSNAAKIKAEKDAKLAARNLRLSLIESYKFNAENVRTFSVDENRIYMDNFSLPNDAVTMKEIVRKHVKTICNQTCIDTFALFLQGSATNHGDLLLWDQNQDGMVQNSEKYSIPEIFEDLSKCHANRLVVAADYPYGSCFARFFRANTPRSVDVVILANDQWYAWNEESIFEHFSDDRWTDECISPTSPFVLFDGPSHPSPTTLSGQPCRHGSSPQGCRQVSRQKFYKLPGAIH